MYIVEWYDQEGNRHERRFDSKEAAQLEADRLKEQVDHVALLWEAEI